MGPVAAPIIKYLERFTERIHLAVAFPAPFVSQWFHSFPQGLVGIPRHGCINIRRHIAEHTGQPYETVAADAERDKYFTAEEAKAYGLVDEVFEYPTTESKDAN